MEKESHTTVYNGCYYLSQTDILLDMCYEIKHLNHCDLSTEYNEISLCDNLVNIRQFDFSTMIQLPIGWSPLCGLEYPLPKQLLLLRT